MCETFVRLFFENSFPLSHSKHLRTQTQVRHTREDLLQFISHTSSGRVVRFRSSLSVCCGRSTLCLTMGTRLSTGLRQVVHIETAISKGSHDGTHCNCNKTCSSGCTSSSGYSPSAHCEDFIQSSRTDVLGS